MNSSLSTAGADGLFPRQESEKLSSVFMRGS
jgi:hypothetical protein